MKALKKLIYALIVSLCVFAVACTEDTTSTAEVGEPDVEGCLGVYFPSQEDTGDLEIDPVDPLTFEYTIARVNTDETVTVPVVFAENTDDLFSVSEVVFEAGEEEAKFTITLSDESELGKKYSCTVQVDDPQFVSQYGQSPALSLSVTRVKWISLGKCAYTEALLTDFWTFGTDPTHPTFNVPVEVREDSITNLDKFNAALAGNGSDADLAGIYRLKNVYKYFALLVNGNDLSDPAIEAEIDEYLATEEPSYIYINFPAYNRGEIELQELNFTVNGGMTEIWSKASYYKANGAESKITEEMYGQIKNGQIIFDSDSALYGPGGDYVGKYYYPETALVVNICPALNQYELVLPDPNTLSDGDFTFADVTLPEGTAFYTEAFGEMWEQNLQVGTPSVTTDDADKRFAEEYGTIYRLPDLYTEDYPVYFCVKNGKINIPSEYAEQAIGIEQLSQELSIIIDAKNSVFNAETNEVSLVAEFVSAKTSFGVFNEVLSATAPEFEVNLDVDLARDFTYTTTFNDVFKSGVVGDEWKSDFQVGTINKADVAADFENVYGTAYCLPSLYTPNYNIYFCGKDGSVSVPSNYASQPTGMEMLGKKIYATVVSGTVSEFGATLKIQFTDESGDTILGTFTESLVTYNWLPVATCTYNSELFGRAFTGLTFSQAEGTNLYRVENTFGAGANLEFYWDSTTNKCQLNGMQYAFTNGSYQVFLGDGLGVYDWVGGPKTWEELEAGGIPQPSYDATTLTFSLYLLYAVPAAGVGAGYGWSDDSIVLDGEPKISTWENVAVGTYTHTADFWLDTPPYAETGLTLQRFGSTDKYKIVGVAGGSMDVEFTYNEASGAVKVQPNATGYKDSDDGSPIYHGDAWAAFEAWGSSYTEETIYGAYPNSYDPDTKTFSFSIIYFSPSGYYYTSNAVNTETFQITGDAPAVSTASVKANCFNKPNTTIKATKMANVAVKEMKLCKSLGLTNEKPVLARKSAATGIANATPVKREGITKGLKAQKVDSFSK